MKCKMKLDILQKVALLIVGVILITFLVHFVVYSVIKYRKKQEKIQEGMSLSQIGKDITSAFSTLDNTFSGVTKTVEDIGIILEDIATLPYEIGSLLYNISEQASCGQAEAADGFKYGWQTFAIIVSCCWDKLKKIGNGKCIFYYIVDIIWGIFYGIFIMLPISLIDTIFGIDLQILLTLFYESFLMPIDAVFFSIFGFHLFQWSDSIITQCYRCEGTIGGRKITQTVDEWAQLFNCSNAEISGGINQMLSALVPSPQWQKWFLFSEQMGQTFQT